MNIGLIGSPDNHYLSQLQHALQLRGHQTVQLELPSVCTRLGTESKRTTPVSLTVDQTDLATLDLCLIRTVPPGSLEQIVYRMDALWGLEQQGVRLLNPAKGLECAVDKFLTFVRLQRACVPFPQTCVCETTDQAIAHFESSNQPMILKPIFGSEGRGLILIDSVDLLWRIGKSLEQTRHVLYLQEYLADSKSDVRLLVLEDRVLGAYERNKIGFRSNAAYEPVVKPMTPDPQLCELAISATKATGCLFAGVDLIHCSQRGWLVLEVNSIPGWSTFERVTGVHVPEVLCDWVESQV